MRPFEKCDEIAAPQFEVELSLLHHLPAQLTAGIQGGVNVCVPLSGQQIRRLIFGERCGALDGTLHRLEWQRDTGVLAGFTRIVEMGP
ncbi:hypothetical protein ACVWYH_006404 [Bradyrhizobium sp. GM24.11]